MIVNTKKACSSLQNGRAEHFSRVGQPVVDRVLSFSEAARAHHYMETNRNVTKIILEVE